MGQRILSVGQCGFDHTRIAHYLRTAFGAQVDGADSFDDAIAALKSGMYDLVLVNRITDFDGSPGVELIRTLKADAGLAQIPVMLVSDQTAAQEIAAAAGAIPGFGKSDLHMNRAHERLKSVLNKL
jgi:two-component system chemotaxis response regulator CheY